MSEKRKVIYAEPIVKVHRGDKACTAKLARKLLGWQEEGKSSFGDDYLLKDSQGVKVRCTNNITNRPYYTSNMEKLKQEILRGNWHLNMENRIIGRTSLIINGQHTLVALVVAVQEWEKEPSQFPCWKTEPTIDTTIAFGCDESDAVVNTVDTPKPRTLADVFFRSKILGGKALKDRKALCKILEYACKTLWRRVGYVEAFHPGLKETHAEFLDFALCHPKLRQCADHIYTENKSENQISILLRSGYASGLLYLMGCSATDPKKYREDEQHEKNLDWSLWDKACDFWVDLAGNEDLDAVRTVMQSLIDADADNINVRMALIVKAWNRYKKGKDVTQKDLQLHFDTDDEGWKTLTECPSVGGIDFADPEVAAAPKEAIEEATKKLRKKKQAKPTQPSKTSTKKPKKFDGSRLIGKIAWVAADEPYKAKVLSVTDKIAKVKVYQGFQGAGNLKTVSLKNLRAKQPSPKPQTG